MKKYDKNSYFPAYGQNIAGRVLYYQKLGVIIGIRELIFKYVRHCGFDVRKYYATGSIELTTPDLMSDSVFWKDRPIIRVADKSGYIDKIQVDTLRSGSLYFHLVSYDHRQSKMYTDGGWHNSKDALSLEDAGTMFEYILDMTDEDKLSVTPPPVRE